MYSSTLSLTPALDGVDGEPHAPAALLPGKRIGIHSTGGWLGPGAGLDGLGKPCAHRYSIPERPSHSESVKRLGHPGPHTVFSLA
jgi:hypothetical protein